MKHGPQPRPPIDRFNEKWIPEPYSGCWLWTGSTQKNGYGTLNVNRWPTLAHRFSYEFHVGVIPPRITIDHLCNTPACVNPNHLRLATYQENILRSNGLSARRARQTHCIRGHALEGSNLRYQIHARGRSRHCRECDRINSRKHWDKVKKESVAA